MLDVMSDTVSQVLGKPRIARYQAPDAFTEATMVDQASPQITAEEVVQQEQGLTVGSRLIEDEKAKQALADQEPISLSGESTTLETTQETEGQGRLLSDEESKSALEPADRLSTDPIMLDVFKKLKKAEGTEIHVGLDTENVTLPYGVVPDTIKIAGQTIKSGKNTKSDEWVKANIDKVDLSSASKKVGNQTIKGSDYDSLEDFAAGVTKAFIDGAKEEYGEDLPASGLASMTKYAFNTGLGGLSWTGAKETATEMKKTDVATLDYQKLFGTVRYPYTGGKAALGLLKRRANDINVFLEDVGGTKAEYVTLQHLPTKKLKYIVMDENKKELFSFTPTNKTTKQSYGEGTMRLSTDTKESTLVLPE